MDLHQTFSTSEECKISDENIPATRLPEAWNSISEAMLVQVKEEQIDDIISTRLPHSRQVFDCVLLSTLLSIRKYKVEEARGAEEDYKKLKLLKDPKIKKNVTALLPETLRDRLKPIGLDIQDQYFTVDQVIRETGVTRLFMAKKYGGSMQCARPKLSAIFLAKHGMNDFLYLPSKFQPEAPQLPGAPGLWLSSTPGKTFEKVMRVFVNIIHTHGPKTSKYQYMGQYELLAANPPSLTVEEWSVQSPKFHSAWANGIVDNGWGNDVRARILLRRELDHEPQQDEVENAVASKRYEVITADEVKAAYFRGEEKLGVLTMKCVGYDNRFQQELHDTFPSWVIPSPKPPSKPRFRKTARKSTGSQLTHEL